MSTNTDTKQMLQDQVDHIAKQLNEGIDCERCIECDQDFEDQRDEDSDCPTCEDYYENEIRHAMSGYDYLQDALDIQYIVNGEGDYLASRILVAFGGPNIWINTQTQVVEGYWWGDSAFAKYYHDEMGINGAVEELWGCR